MEDAPAPRGPDLATQVGYYLRDLGEASPVPILGGFVVEPQPGGRVHVYRRLPGPSLFMGRRRPRAPRRYERLPGAWGLATELRLDVPEPSVACWRTRR